MFKINKIAKTITLALALVITVLNLNPINVKAENTYDIDTLAGKNFGLLGSAAKTPCDCSQLKFGETYKLVKASGAWSQEEGADYATKLRGYFFQIKDLEGNVVGHGVCGDGSLKAPSDCEFTIGEDTEEVTDPDIVKILANGWGGCPELMGQSYFSLKGDDNNSQAYVLLHSYLHNKNNTTRTLTDEDKVVIQIAEDLLADAPEVPAGCTGKAYYYQASSSVQPIYFWVEETAPNKESNANVTMTYDPADNSTKVGGVFTEDETNYNTKPDLDGYTLYDTAMIYAKFKESVSVSTIQDNLNKALSNKVGTSAVKSESLAIHTGSKNFGSYLGINTNAYTFGSSYVPYLSAKSPSIITKYDISSPKDGLLKAFEQTKKSNTSEDNIVISGLRTSVASEIYVKDNKVNYFLYEININKNGSTVTASSSLSKSGNYSILINDKLIKGYGKAMIVVENTAGDLANQQVVDDLTNAYQTPTSNPLAVAQALYGTSNAFTPCKVGIGYNKHDNEYRGYTIILVKYEDTTETTTDGQLTLYQEELNHWYSDMVANSSAEVGQTHTWRLQKASEVWSYVLTNTITHTYYVEEKDKDTDEIIKVEKNLYHNNYNTQNYHLIVIDKTTGLEASEDGNSWYYVAAGNGTVNNPRSTLANGIDYDMSQFSGVLTTYRFNQVRAFSGDVRTISSITGTGTNKGEYLTYSQSVLKCKLGATWSGSNPTDFVENLKMEAVSAVTGSHTRYDVHSLETCDQEHSWYSLAPTNTFSPFTHNGENSITFTHTVTCRTLKYNPQTRSKGYAKVGGTLINGIAKEFSNNRIPSFMNVCNFGNFAVVKDNGISVKYLAEVPMTEEKLDNGIVNKYLAMTISEKPRNTELTSLYFMHIQKTNNPVQGVTYSESSLAGVKDNNGYTYITNGSGLTLKTDCNFTMNFYGYALDLISATDDITMTIPSYNNSGYLLGTMYVNYTDIINDNTNVRTVWGNSNSNASELQIEFKNWVNELTNPELYGVDAELKIENGSEYTGFSASFGNLTSAESLENEYTFPITVVKGAIVKDTIYNSLIWQIATDNECTYAEAEKLFEDSGIISAITDAIESSIDTDNKSNTPRNGGAGYWYYNTKTGNKADISYNANHWYDECVKTFVIRRYKYQGFKFTDIVLSDKIDINESSFSTSELNNQGYTAKWYLNIYFTKQFTGASFTDAQCYNPNAITELTGRVNLQQAAQYGSLLLYNAHIEDLNANMKADFKVQNSTTVNDFAF